MTDSVPEAANVTVEEEPPATKVLPVRQDLPACYDSEPSEYARVGELLSEMSRRVNLGHERAAKLFKEIWARRGRGDSSNG